MATQSVTSLASESVTSLRAFFGRLVWMMVGPLTLAVCALVLTQRQEGWLTPLNLAYFIILSGMLLGRWAEFRYGQPMTATGEPASIDHLRHYAIGAGIIALAIWVTVNLLGNGLPHSLG